MPANALEKITEQSYMRRKVNPCDLERMSRSSVSFSLVYMVQNNNLVKISEVEKCTNPIIRSKFYPCDLENSSRSTVSFSLVYVV